MIGHDIAAALPELRAQGESTLRDECRFEKRTGRTVDPDTGARVDVWTAYMQPVPCRARRTVLAEQVSDSGSSQVTAQRMILAVPHWVEGVEVGHRAVVTFSEDSTLVGRELYVRAVPRGTDMVLRRLTVTEVQE